MPTLDVPVPQMVDQPVAVLARFDLPIPEQVIEVHKISCSPRFSRTVLRSPRMAEQPVEVPVPSFEGCSHMARFRDDAGRRWCLITGPQGYSSASWFDSGYMIFPVYGGFFTRILRSILILLSCFVFAAKSTGKLDFLVPRSCRQRHWYAWAGFAGVDALRAMFPSFVSENSAMLGPQWCMYASVYGVV